MIKTALFTSNKYQQSIIQITCIIRMDYCLLSVLWVRQEICLLGKRRAWYWNWQQYWKPTTCLGTGSVLGQSHPVADMSPLGPLDSWQRAPHFQHCNSIWWRDLQTSKDRQSHSSEESEVAVSYTHLTLPTICSV